MQRKDWSSDYYINPNATVPMAEKYFDTQMERLPLMAAWNV